LCGGADVCGPHQRKQGFFTEQVPVSAYGGSSKKLKDLKDHLLAGVLRGKACSGARDRARRKQSEPDKTESASVGRGGPLQHMAIRFRSFQVVAVGCARSCELGRAGGGEEMHADAPGQEEGH